MKGEGQQGTYRLCPACGRAVPIRVLEHHCPNDGSPMLQACPACQAPITSPYARYCTRCGSSLMQPRKDH